VLQAAAAKETVSSSCSGENVSASEAGVLSSPSGVEDVLGLEPGRTLFASEEVGISSAQAANRLEDPSGLSEAPSGTCAGAPAGIAASLVEESGERCEAPSGTSAGAPAGVAASLEESGDGAGVPYPTRKEGGAPYPGGVGVGGRAPYPGEEAKAPYASEGGGGVYGAEPYPAGEGAVDWASLFASVVGGGDEAALRLSALCCLASNDSARETLLDACGRGKSLAAEVLNSGAMSRPSGLTRDR